MTKAWRTGLIALVMLLGVSAAVAVVVASPDGEPVDDVTGSPYIDPAQLTDRDDRSFYAQPWRAYLETVPAERFLAGIGIQYTLRAGADDAAAIAALADAGIKSLRYEVSWGQLGLDGQLTEGNRSRLRTILGLARQHGMSVLVLLNANHGRPTPSSSLERSVISGGEIGSRHLVLDSVEGLVPGRSGLSDLTTRAWMAEVLVTEVEPATGAVSLSKPLPVALPAAEVVEIDTLAYEPLFPVGTPEFDATAAGWTAYVDTVADEVEAAGVESYELEIWNELTFGSKFLSAANYYEAPTVPTDDRPFRSGGRGWELARLTTELLERDHPGARTIWGFSNTSFFNTPIELLPPGTDGQSYHPYHTARTIVPDDLRDADDPRRFVGGCVPSLELALPEGQAQLAIMAAQLPRLLEPSVRESTRPPGTDAFSHQMTEHGYAPGGAGERDVSAGEQQKAKAVLRAATFWLNKGIERIYLSSSWKADPLGNGLLPPDLDGELTSPALVALGRWVAAFDGVAPIAEPRSLDIEVTAIGAQPPVFPAFGDCPALPARDVFAALPFQIADGRFAVATYVMSYDLTKPQPETEFRLTVGGLDAGRAEVELYDPLLDRTIPVRSVAAGDGTLAITVPAVDYPRLLLIDG